MSPSKKPQTPIRLEEEIRLRLDQFLRRNKRQWGSINAVVNEALDRFLPPLETDAEPAPPATSKPDAPLPAGGPLDFD